MENHTGDGFYLQGDTLTDSLTVSDGTPTLTLNDANTLFQSLTDSLTITETTADVNPVQQFTDSLSITESVAFDYYVSASDSLTISDSQLRFTGVLFWDYAVAESLTLDDATVASALRDSVYESGVFVETDTTTVGVYE